MAVFKCKMCGGTVEFEEGATVGVCDSCGTKQTLPKLDDEKRAQLYERANELRRENEFDKATSIYEMILAEDNKDAEAYWSLVLCKYGIEYVEDPRSHKRIPTVNRAQYIPIFEDNNYKMAIENADLYQKGIFEEEARVINNIQKGILEISSKEEPFDIFICYKETDEFGGRTPDSVYAQDLYDVLIKEGYKVFFSRVTLEDKLGSAYEPYIFAALNSAKVMLAIGTSSKNYNSVWVKNEWSRYLSIVNDDKQKVLIPVYKDIDPKDLPVEFAYLQGQDMSKLGFMQDLFRGIAKIVGPVFVSQQVPNVQQYNQNNFDDDLNLIEETNNNCAEKNIGNVDGLEDSIKLEKTNSENNIQEHITDKQKGRKILYIIISILLFGVIGYFAIFSAFVSLSVNNAIKNEDVQKAEHVLQVYAIKSIVYEKNNNRMCEYYFDSGNYDKVLTSIWLLYYYREDYYSVPDNRVESFYNFLINMEYSAPADAENAIIAFECLPSNYKSVEMYLDCLRKMWDIWENAPEYEYGYETDAWVYETIVNDSSLDEYRELSVYKNFLKMFHP